MKMPFGKYKGQGVDTLPLNYIEWVLDNAGDLDPILKKALEHAYINADTTDAFGDLESDYDFDDDIAMEDLC